MLAGLDVPQLGRVNLIVGKNNSGKTTILEALRILAARANRTVLDEILNVHDENLRYAVQGPSADGSAEDAPYQNFFHGRTFPVPDQDPIYIGDMHESQFVRLGYTLYVEDRQVQDDGSFVVKRRPPATDDESETEQALLVTTSGSEQVRWILLGDQVRRPRYFAEERLAIPFGYVPTRFLPSSYLADLWDGIALTANDKWLGEALQIIEPRVEGLAFVKREADRPGRPAERAAIVKLSGVERPLPLNSMGDGMLRIVQLLLSLFPAKGGFYLVDELENGLHFSVQEQVWTLLFQLTKELNIQIFAATHSWDCIEAFKNVACKRNEDAVLFRVARSALTSDLGKTIATVFDSAALAKLTQADVEVR